MMSEDPESLGSQVTHQLEKKEEEKEGQKNFDSSAFASFISHFQEVRTPEEKLRLALDFMRFSLSQSGNPRFEDFWEARRLLLPLFKENMNPKGRAQFWAEYLELSAEGRRLKEILDEQSAFAVEQIELAISAIEKDLEAYTHLLEQMPEIVFPAPSKTISTRKEIYNTLQRELYLLNTLASRVNGLRKEVIKTGMKVRQKNQFFERLSLCGDRVFPRRKELIKRISDEFLKDVEAFVKAYFTEGESQKSPAPSYFLREEIKALQSIAKSLTLNTHSFTETRLQLSHSWDQLRQQEKEKKKELTQKKQIFKENADLVVEKIHALTSLVASGELSLEEMNRQANEILEYMRTLELGREEVWFLKDELQKSRQPILNKLKEQEQEREKKEREAVQQRSEKIQALRTQIATLLEQAEKLELEKIIESRDQCIKEFDQMQLSKIEKQPFERLFKQLKEAIHDKKVKAVMALSKDALEALEQLKTVLQQRKEQRQEIKAQLEQYRKALGGSGFDFEKAMQYRELIEEEKLRLEKANESIQEIEEKIEEIE